MAKQITPQGYTYGSDPKSHHPFWEKETVIEPLEITPTEEEQVITAPDGVTGYNPITVKPAAAEAFLETLEVTPSGVNQFIDAEDYEVDGWNIVDVAAVTADVDPNIQSRNIKNGVSILGVGGALTPSNLVVSGSVIHLLIDPQLIATMLKDYDSNGSGSITGIPVTRFTSQGIIETYANNGARQDSVVWESPRGAATLNLYAVGIGNPSWGSNTSYRMSKENWQYILEDLNNESIVALRFIRSGIQTNYYYLIISAVPSTVGTMAVDLTGYLAR